MRARCVTADHHGCAPSWPRPGVRCVAGAARRGRAPAAIVVRAASRAPQKRGAGGKAPRSPPPQQQPEEGDSSVLGSALLVSGTAVGAGILALPAVTQESGFLASAAALLGGAGYSAATGLLLAELYINATRGSSEDLGASGSAAFASIARSTLGEAGLRAGAGAYVFLHVALLVAYISKSAEIISAASGAGPLPAAAAFTAALGGLCYAASGPLLDKVNGGLVALILVSFAGLLAAAAGGVEPEALLRADWGAVPGTLPVIALSFVYHNVVPVICTNLRGDPAKIRTAITGGLAVPVVMFVIWNGAILGSLDSLGTSSSAATESAVPAAEAVDGLRAAAAPQAGGAGVAAGAAAPPLAAGAAAGAPAAGAAAGAAAPAARPRVEDPLTALSAADPAVGSLIGSFSLLAVATSFIGFVLGLTDFLAGALALGSRRDARAYALTLLPPLALAVSFPGIFLSAIDSAGTYGVLTLFGLLPCAMAWAARYGGEGSSGSGSSGGGGGSVVLVPGGKPVLALIAGAAGAVIANEVAGTLAGLL